MNGLEKMFGIKIPKETNPESIKMTKLMNEYEERFGYLNLSTEAFDGLKTINFIIENCLHENKKVEELFPSINDMPDDAYY